jgi:hypothetical protein
MKLCVDEEYSSICGRMLDQRFLTRFVFRTLARWAFWKKGLNPSEGVTSGRL